MPPPIVPAPMTATRSISRAGVFAGRSGDLGRRALGEERVAQRARFRRLHELHEQLALERRPSSKGFATAAATASTHLSGAGKFFASAPTVLRANWKNASAFG